MNLLETKEAFRSGSLSKSKYIEEMHALHAVLFEYSRFLKGTEISKIEISDSGVVMTFREHGTKMLCDENDHRIAPLETLNFDEYEPEDAAMMGRLVESGNTVFDIGANFGYYSLMLGSQVGGLRILAFEPMPKTFEYLKKNIALNDARQIELHNFGFSEEEGEKSFYYYPEGSGNASLVNVSERSDAQRVTCHFKTLDGFVAARRTAPDFIKCDVEGAELFVFRGGEKTLREHKPVVFTEMLRKWASKFGYHPNEMIDFFAKLGYGCFVVKNGRLSEFSRVTDETTETNYFFLHREKHAAKIAALT